MTGRGVSHYIENRLSDQRCDNHIVVTRTKRDALKLMLQVCSKEECELSDSKVMYKTV